MEQPKKINVFVADLPGLSISIPFRENEDLQFLLDRVSNRLLDTELGSSDAFKGHFYLDGIMITDYTKSFLQYKVFGNFLTYYQGYNSSSGPLKMSTTINANSHPPSSKIKRSIRIPDATGQRDKFQKLKATRSKKININIVSTHSTILNLNSIHQSITVQKLKKELSKQFRHLSSSSSLPVARHHLFYNGSELENKYMLSHYHIRNNANIYLVYPTTFPNDQKKDDRSDTSIFGDVSFSSSKKVEQSISSHSISVKTLSGKIILNHVHLEQMVWNVKQMIHKTKSIAVDQQRLLYAGKELQDDQTISQQCKSLSIKDNLPTSTIYLAVRLANTSGINPVDLSAASPPFVNADICSRLPNSISFSYRELKIIPFVMSGRQITKGLNVEVQCHCTPIHPVILKFGYGLYEISQSASNHDILHRIPDYLFSFFARQNDREESSFLNCPNCHHRIRTNNTPVSLGFAECYYRFVFMLQDGNIRYKTDWTQVSAQDQFQQYFTVNIFSTLKNNHASVQWTRFGIETRPLKASISDDHCMMCLKKFTQRRTQPPGVAYKRLPCHHRFHYDCLDAYSHTFTCPCQQG